MLKLLLVLVIRCHLSATAGEKDPWFYYVEDQVELDNLDEPKAYQPEYADALKKERLVTFAYDVPERWVIEYENSYSVLLFAEASHKITDDKYCGGALLTVNTVLTICSCVASYLSWVLGPDATYREASYALHEDMGKNIFVIVDSVNASDKPLPVNLPYQLLSGKGNGQLENPRCMEAYKGALRGRNKAWEQRTNVAVVKFTPDYKFAIAGMFVPWPPIPLTYDVTLHDKKIKESNMWAVHRARSPQSVLITSYKYKLNHSVKSKYYDAWGNEINVESIRAGLRATLCDQDFCVKDFPDIDRNVPSEDRKRITCFCDDNEADTLCRGLFGSPVLHDGDLHGLLIEPLQCVNKRPRASLVLAIDGLFMDYILTAVPGLEERLEKEINATLFRDNAIVQNYDAYLPQADLMPEVLSIPDTPETRSSSSRLVPFLTFSLFLIAVVLDNDE